MRPLPLAVFEGLVADALDQVPPELLALMDNVVVLVEDDAPPDDPGLLGLYEGVPLTERDHHWAAGSCPAQLMQAFVVDAEVVRDLVHHGDPDLLDHVGVGVADGQDRPAEDLHRVG